MRAPICPAIEERRTKPRVFVSSTIADFRDLRSALKFWLEEMDFEVQMSEFTDFDRRPEEGTFESCFNAIKACHYYILLIGGRRGSVYTNGVSVTQQEYRVAAELAQQGLIKPIVFLRSEVATALAERRAIAHSTVEDGQGTSRNVGGTSATLDDPDFTQTFINEIGATQHGTASQYGPSGSMWYYRFSAFRDVIDALRVTLLLQHPIRRQAQLANVRAELNANLAALVDRQKDGTLAPFTRWLTVVRNMVALPQPTLRQQVRLTPPQANLAMGFWYFNPSPDQLHTVALQEAILSSEFLSYDQATQRMVPTPDYEAMQSLLTLIHRYRTTHEIIAARVTSREAFYEAQRHKQGATIAADDLLWLYGLHDRLQDITRFSIALLRRIVDPSRPFAMPELNPSSPLKGESEMIAAEHPTSIELEKWIFAEESNI